MIQENLLKELKDHSASSELKHPGNFSPGLSDLKLERRHFSNFVVRYSYAQRYLSEVLEIVNYHYPKLLYKASANDNHAKSIDVNALFSQIKINADDLEFMLYSQGYISKEGRLLSHCDEAIDKKDTEGS